MRSFCVVVLLAWTVGSADVLVADQRQSAGGLTGTKPREQPLADIPKEFGFLFLSPEQLDREAAKGPTYWEDLWKGLPYDSISLELSPAGCVGLGCSWSMVTLHRATVSGIVMTDGELRGRAELHTFTQGNPLLPGALPEARRLLGPGTSDFEGSVRIFEFANLSYLLHRARFLQLPDRYDCRSCPADGLYVTLSVVAGGKTKSVTDHAFARPPELWAIQQAFDSVSKRIQWTQKVKGSDE